MTELADVPLGLRFWQKVDIGDCWHWTANTCHQGYGFFKLDGRNQRAHRVAYEALVGPIPAGLQIDHLCKNRTCVNPDHLEPVTGQENVRRSAVATVARARQQSHTACKNGHDHSPENTLRLNGYRYCRPCRRINDARRVPRNRKPVAA
jgi:HNH endonuclease